MSAEEKNGNEEQELANVSWDELKELATQSGIKTGKRKREDIEKELENMLSNPDDVVTDDIDNEDRIDENGISAFKSLGYERLSDTHVSIYKSFKRYKDMLQPGRLTPEGLAFVAVLTDLMDNKAD